MAKFDDMKLAVQALTGGKNTVILDDMEMPSIMVAWPKQKVSDLITGGTDITHPGSIVNSVEKLMYVSKYQNIVVNNRAYSLPFQDPKATINFDAALAACRTKQTDGGVWCLTPYSLWSQIALWCRKNGTMPRGNNNYGKDHAYSLEKGAPTLYESATAASHAGEPTRCATGSGPATWNHNWLPDGIADLNGNVNEWCAGIRMVDGEFQFIPYANCMDPDISMGANSTAWKALNASGEYVEPGSSGTLKYDWLSSKLTLITGSVTDTENVNRSTGYTSMAADSGLTVPELAKILLLYPDELGGDYGGDAHYANLTGERLPFCGGTWINGSTAGVFYVYLGNFRSYATSYIGFRSAYCDFAA